MRQGIVGPLTTAALVTAIHIAFAAPTLATDRDERTARDRAEQTLRDGADKVMRALDLMIRSIPQYAAPEMRENGDIIIRRKHPKPAPPNRPPLGDEDGAST